ncbi:MAG TPA: hypothetical protein VI757_09555 [Bacteroidia bacterium]|nr:hypothetical protein [Bacteroidia bacterium]
MLKSLNPFSKNETSVGSFVFAPLFYSALHVFHFVRDSDFALHKITTRFVGRAAVENFSIPARVNTFYFSVLIFFASFFVLAIGLKWLIRKKIIAPNELLIFNLSSFCGLLFLYFKLTGGEMYSSINFLFAVHAALFVLISLRNFRKGKVSRDDTDIHFFTWSVIIAFCLLFLSAKILALFGVTRDFSFTLFLAVGISLPSILFEYFIAKNSPELRIIKWADALSVLAWIPLLSVLSDEMYMILNQRNIHGLPPGIIFLIFFFLIVSRKYFALRKTDRIVSADLAEILSAKYFPVLAAGIIAFALYNPIVPASQEMFESANGVLPVQQFFEFGKIPFADIFSSHMLSDFFMNFIYVFLNGYSNITFFCYDFIVDVAAAVVIYYSLKKITGSGYWAFLVVLFYPYTAHLIPTYVCFALIPLLALLKAINAPSEKNYFTFLLLLFLLVLWRLDLGFAGFTAAFITTAFITVQRKKISFMPGKFFNALFFALILFALLFILFFTLRGKGLFSSAGSAFDYFSSAQSYGNVELSSARDWIYYTLHFIFPFVLLLLTGYALYIFFNKSEIKVRLLCVVLIYLAVYYLANFQRGLVRHGLLEYWDVPLTSFAFFIMMLGMLIYFSDKNIVTKFLWVMPLMTLLISEYKFPQPELNSNNLYHQAYLRLKHFPVIKPSAGKINRMTVTENFAKENYEELKSFTDKFLKPEETFADFSNTPMLYYYLHRANPHFFSQSPLSYHSEGLQRKYIDEIKTNNPKILLFSSYPSTWFDNTDGVANTLRHYRIAEYLFRHYRPAFVLSKSYVWLRNDLPISEQMAVAKIDSVHDAAIVSPVFYIGSLAYVWGKYDQQFLSSKYETVRVVLERAEVVSNENEKKILFTPVTDRQSSCYLLIRAEKKTEKKTEIVANYGSGKNKSGGFVFLLSDTKMSDYVIRISSQYNWSQVENDWLTISPIGGDVTIEKILFLKGD